MSSNPRFLQLDWSVMRQPFLKIDFSFPVGCIDVILEFFSMPSYLAYINWKQDYILQIKWFALKNQKKTAKFVVCQISKGTKLVSALL